MESEIRNAYIKKVKIGWLRECCIMTAWIHLEGNGWGVNVGGMRLDEGHGRPSWLLGWWVMRVLQTLGVESWEELPGRYCRCITSGPGTELGAIGHLMQDKWFNYREEIEQMKRNNGGELPDRCPVMSD